jgi:septal ring factor EnvC (AmiA/AmiB activator)
MFQKPTVLKFRRTTNGWIEGGRLAVALVFLLALLAPAAALAQSKKELEAQRKKIIRDIQVTDKMLKKTTQTKEATYDRFVTLQTQIRQREQLIRTLTGQIRAAEEEIERNTRVVSALSRDVEKMQEEYGRMLRSAYRRKSMTSPWMFVLSAESLNQSFRRWLFLRKYDRLRKQQSEAIASTRRMLQTKLLNLEETRQEKTRLLASLQGQRSTLSTELTDKDRMLKTLARDEDRLRQDLQKKEAAHEALNSAIENVIQEEVRKKVEAARKPRPAKPAAGKPAESPAATTAAPAEAVPEDATSLDFRRNRGRLPWPVENGFVARPYGRQKHPTIRTIEITNNGIDIRTDDGSAVRAVYEGVVAGVQFIPGHDYTVILQHGNYYTVYSNLSETALTKGQTVKARQAIGRVSTNAITGSSELHFELWHQKERLNPSLWIRK